MVTRQFITALLAAALLAGQVLASAASIPDDQVDKTKIYFGSPSEFEKAGEVRLEDVIKATPEYQEVKKEKIKRGTGKYWVLLSRASDRATRAITQVGEETEYDLIALEGYLGDLDPAVEADDLTDEVIEVMGEKSEDS